MANSLNGNPIRCDTAATVIDDTTGETLVQGLQWVDETAAAGGILANADDLIMTINGITVGLVVTAVATQLSGAVAWEAWFSKPIRVKSIIVSVIEGGTLLVWKA